MRSHIRTFLLPALVLFAALACSVFTATRYPTLPQRNLGSLNDAARALPALTRTYTDPVYGFSFRYPRDLRAYYWADATTHVVSALDLSGSQALEIRVKTAYQEPEALSADFIREQFRDSLKGEPQEVVFASGIRAFQFVSEDSESGKALNTVFVHPDRASAPDDLYDILDIYLVRTSAPYSPERLGAILGSWQFKD